MADEQPSEVQPSRIMRDTHNKTLYSTMTACHGIDEKDNQKNRILKKIVELSSIKKNIVKILLKLMKLGKKSLDKAARSELLTYAMSILEKDRYGELQEILGFDE